MELLNRSITIFFLILSLLLLSSFSANAICVPRNIANKKDAQDLARPPSSSPSHISYPPENEESQLKVKKPRDSDTTTAPKPQTDNTYSSEVKKICAKTSHPDLCVESVLPFIGEKVDLTTVLRTALSFCRNMTNQAIEKADEISKLKENGRNRFLPGILGTCLENYNSALDNINNAEGSISSSDGFSLNSMLSSVLADATTCEDSFSERPEAGPSPLAEIDDKLHRMVTILLDISDMIYHYDSFLPPRD